MTARGEDLRETEGEPPHPSSERDLLEEKIEALERQLTRLNQNLLAAARVLGPLVLGALFLAFIMALYRGSTQVAILSGIAAYPWPWLNKVFVVVPLVTTGTLTVREATVIFGIVDALIAMWFILNFPLLYKVPRVGHQLERVERAMRRELKRRPALRVFSVSGTFLWVALPFPGTGTITGAILGRFLGLEAWKNFVVVTVASILAVYGYAAGTDAIVTAFDRSAAQGWAAIVLLLGLFGLGWIVYRAWWKPRRARRRAAAQPRPTATQEPREGTK